MKTENVSTLRIHKLSNEQFLREQSAERLVPGEIYLTPDDDAGTENVFIAEYGITSFADIISESVAGKLVFVKHQSEVLFLPLVEKENSIVVFRGMDDKKITQWTVTSDNVWNSEQIGTIETTSNKTTAIGEESTDTQYPSAKAVYDFINTVSLITPEDINTICGTTIQVVDSTSEVKF